MGRTFYLKKDCIPSAKGVISLYTRTFELSQFSSWLPKVNEGLRMPMGFDGIVLY